MTKNYDFPLLFRVGIVSVERSVAKHRHLDLEQVGHHELEYPKGNYSPLGWVHKEDVVERHVVSLVRNTAAGRTVSH